MPADSSRTKDRTHNVERLRRRWARMTGWIDVSLDDDAPVVGRLRDHPMMEPARLPEPLQMGTEGFVEAVYSLLGIAVVVRRGAFDRDCGWRVEVGNAPDVVWCEASGLRDALCNAVIAYHDRVWAVENDDV